MSEPVNQNNNGVILTVGLRVNGERCAIVLPVACDSTILDDISRCQDACDTFEASSMADFVAIITSDCYVSFLQGEGMVDGMIPHRTDFEPTDNPGTDTTPTVPTNTGGLVSWYCDPADITAPHRMRVAKNTIPGISIGSVSGDIISSGLQVRIGTWAQKWVDGIPSDHDSASNWYRYLAVPKPRSTLGQDLKRVAKIDVRGYMATQRRRFIPRG